MAENITAIVAHLTECKPHTIQASAKIARFIARELGLRLFDRPDSPLMDATPDVLILVNSPTGFAPDEMRWAVARMANHAKACVFVQNDYKMAPPSQVKRYARENKRCYPGWSYWTTVPDRMAGDGRFDEYINWNQLGFDQDVRRSVWNDRTDEIFYWGALRPSREEYFAQFLNLQNVPVTVSTGVRSVKKFQQYTPNAKIETPAENLTDRISRSTTTLYLEDPRSHKLYCSPATRFYEALSAGTAILFHAPAVASSMQDMGVEDDWVFETPEDVEKLFPYAQQIAEEQWEVFSDAYRTQLTWRLKQAYRKMINQLEG